MAVTLPVLIPRLGKSSGDCTFSTAALVAGNEYAVRFYNNGQPVPSPSVVISIAGRSDACGVCGGNNATCTGCNGVPNSGKVVDSCGVCGGACDGPFSISVVNPVTDYQRSFLYVAWRVYFIIISYLFHIYFIFIFEPLSHPVHVRQMAFKVALDVTLGQQNSFGCVTSVFPGFYLTGSPSFLGVVAFVLVSIPLLPSPPQPLQFFFPLPSSATSGLLAIPSPMLRDDWPSFALFNTGTIFNVEVYLLAQYPELRRVSASSYLSLNASAVVDACGLCGGSGASCAGCDGVPNRLRPPYPCESMR